MTFLQFLSLQLPAKNFPVEVFNCLKIATISGLSKDNMGKIHNKHKQWQKSTCLEFYSKTKCSNYPTDFLNVLLLPIWDCFCWRPILDCFYIPAQCRMSLWLSDCAVPWWCPLIHPSCILIDTINMGGGRKIAKYFSLFSKKH